MRGDSAHMGRKDHLHLSELQRHTYNARCFPEHFLHLLQPSGFARLRRTRQGIACFRKLFLSHAFTHHPAIIGGLGV